MQLGALGGLGGGGCGVNMGLWECSMVCIGKNIADCPKNCEFLAVKCALCTNTPMLMLFGLYSLDFWWVAGLGG